MAFQPWRRTRVRAGSRVAMRDVSQAAACEPMIDQRQRRSVQVAVSRVPEEGSPTESRQSSGDCGRAREIAVDLPTLRWSPGSCGASRDVAVYPQTLRCVPGRCGASPDVAVNPEMLR